MVNILVLLLVTIVCSVACLPLETSDLENGTLDVLPVAIEGRKEAEGRPAQTHTVQRRFINPLFSLGMSDNDDMVKMRTKRSESYDECEKLQLCKLHAQSHRNFFAAYELYFINKENARLWDHHARSVADCERRYGDCYYK